MELLKVSEGSLGAGGFKVLELEGAECLGRLDGVFAALPISQVTDILDFEHLIN